jgi:hypothetical protein
VKQEQNKGGGIKPENDIQILMYIAIKNII